MLGAGIAKTADNKLHGDSWSHALGQGALNAGLTGIGGAGLGALKSAFGGANAAGEAAGSFVPSSSAPFEFGEDAVSSGGGGGGFLSSLGAGAKNTGSWLASHPGAVSGTLQGAGQLGTMGAENAQRKAQTTAIDLNNQQTQYDMESKKRRDAALAPLIQALMGQEQSRLANPYTPPRPVNGQHYTAGPYTYG